MSTTTSSIAPVLAFGDVILVRFPYTNLAGSKLRPAVVVSSSEYNRQRRDVVTLSITSQLRAPRAFGELWLVEWKAANLLKPSAIKPVFATFEKSLIARSFGSLHPADLAAVRQLVSALLG